MSKRVNTAIWDAKYKRWKINVQKNGQRRTFYSSIAGIKGRREANAKADAWLDDGIIIRKKTVATLWPEYIEYYTTNVSASTSTIQRLEVDGSNYIVPVIGIKIIDTITNEQLQRLVNLVHHQGSQKKEIRQRRPRSLPLSKKSIQNLINTINLFFRWCRSENYTTLTPDLLVPKTARKKEKSILQPQSLITIFNDDTTLFHGKRIFDDSIYAYRFQVSCGLRPGELAGIWIGDINPNTRELHLKRSLNTSGEITQGKNENAVRCIRLPALAMEAYHAQINLLKSNGVKLNFNTPLFQISSQHTYYGHWTHYLESHDLPHVSLYELRHTFVSIVKTLPEGRIRPIVGHSKNMDTYGTYAHILKGEIEETTKEIDRLFEKLLQPQTDISDEQKKPDFWLLMSL